MPVQAGSEAEALEIALEMGDADDIGRAYVNKADIEAFGGDPGRAFETSVEGIQVAGEWGVAASYGTYCAYGAVAYGFERGRWSEVREILAEADRLAGVDPGTNVYRAAYVLEFFANAGDPGFDPRPYPLVSKARAVYSG